MANIEHWIARNPADGIEVPIWQPEDVDTYEADGWRIAGPFVSADTHQGAVDGLRWIVHYGDVGQVPLAVRLDEVVTKARVTLDRFGGQ